MRIPTINKITMIQLVTMLLVMGNPNTLKRISGAGETAAFAAGKTQPTSAAPTPPSAAGTSYCGGVVQSAGVFSDCPSLAGPAASAPSQSAGVAASVLPVADGQVVTARLYRIVGSSDEDVDHRGDDAALVVAVCEEESGVG